MKGSVTITVLDDVAVQAKGELDAPDLADKLAILDVMVHTLGLKISDLVFYLSIFNDLRQNVTIVDCTKIDNLADAEIDWAELFKQMREGDINAGSEKE